MGDQINIGATETRRTGKWCSWTRHTEEALCDVEKKILSCKTNSYFFSKHCQDPQGNFAMALHGLWILKDYYVSSSQVCYILSCIIALHQFLLTGLKTDYKSYYVDIGAVVGKHDRIWTISMNSDSKKIPLVLLHGMASGSALWCPNLDAFAADRPVYAIDLLGFAHSSRPKFSSDALKAEAQWVESVEEWRREVNLSQFILLGHSLGGYIASAYAIKYPERVRHLILADPWGFPERPPKELEKPRPLWIRPVLAAMQTFNPLFAIRAAGPAGLWLVSKTRPDIPRKYAQHLQDAETIVPEYIYQCNSQTPSGESAFLALTTGLAYPKHPMINRLDQLHSAVPITDIYGSKSWVLGAKPDEMAAKRPLNNINTKIIKDAGHHIYLDIPEEFNKYVLEACAKAEEHDPKIEPRANISTNGNADDNDVLMETQSTVSNGFTSDQPAPISAVNTAL